MIINFYGKSFIKLQVGDTIIAVNPPDIKKSGYKGSRFGADIAISSNMSAECFGVDTVNYSSKTPFRISSPGDFEVGKVRVIGYHTRRNIEDEYINTMYMIYWDDLTIVVLGNIGTKEDILPSIRENIDAVDIAIVGIAGGEQADIYTAISSLSAGIIIPVGYENDKDKNIIEFEKLVGDLARKEEKLTIRKSDITEGKGDIIILSAS